MNAFRNFKYVALLLALAPLSMAHACGARSPMYTYNGHAFSVLFTCTFDHGFYTLTGVSFTNHEGAKLEADTEFLGNIGPVSERATKTVTGKSVDAIDSTGVTYVDVYKWKGGNWEGSIYCDVSQNACSFHKPK